MLVKGAPGVSIILYAVGCWEMSPTFAHIALRGISQFDKFNIWFMLH